MHKKIIALLFSAVLALAAIDSLAGIDGPPTVSPSSQSDNEVYLGLLWNFGGTYVPQVELGYRKIDVDHHGDVEGAGVSVSFTPGTGFDLLKLKGIKGGRSAQGELGVGYSLQHGAFLGTLGVQGNHINAGVDYLFGVGPKVFGGINTIGKYSKSKNCPSGYSYNSGSGQCDAVMGGMEVVM